MASFGFVFEKFALKIMAIMVVINPIKRYVNAAPVNPYVNALLFFAAYARCHTSALTKMIKMPIRTRPTTLVMPSDESSLMLIITGFFVASAILMISNNKIIKYWKKSVLTS